MQINTAGSCANRSERIVNWRHVLFLIFFMFSGNNSADANEQTPYDIVLATTDKIVVEIEQSRAGYQQHPEEFHQRIDHILSGITDFYSFSRSVMGVYASKSAMAQLSGEQQVRLEQNIQRFSQRFKQGLIETYAKGLMKFSGEKIEVLKPRESKLRPSKLITQRIYGDRTDPYKLQYKFRKNKSGEWKLRNLTIETVNLGKVFREQFASEVRRLDGDIDAVIDNWAVNTVQSELDNSSAKGEE